jgi:uncharacterized membrane protein SirB2
MIEFYPQIKLVHVAAVLASGGLFALRGAAVQLGGAWAMAAPLRYLSYTIDTVLLTAALMLATILKLQPLQHPWLLAKIGLLVVYVVLGTLALKRARSRKMRFAAWSAALLVYAMIITIARAHHPYGIFLRLAATIHAILPIGPPPMHC